jgi:hypothetical protein
MQSSKWFRTVLSLCVSLAVVGCGGGITSTPLNSQLRVGTSFVIGTDAPLASVVSFRVTFTGLNVSDGTNTAALLSQPTDIEFARLNGLRTLIDMRTVNAGTYTSVTATLASPVISFLDTSTTPPSINTINGTLTSSSVTVQLPQPLVVDDNGLVGMFMDFRLASSLERDANGQLTGNVTPHIVFRPVQPGAPDAEIDELRGGVVSVNVAGNSFVMQGPHGRQLTVTTDANTLFEPGEDLSALNTNTIVEVSGSLQRGTLNLQATSVQIVSQERFLLAGLITDVRPAVGPADAMDLFVRTELPDIAGITPGRSIATITFNGNERFLIHHFRLPLSIFLFNRASLVPGQRVSAGGQLIATTTPPTLDTRRVTLHRQGLEGGWVPGSTIGNNKTGSFEFLAGGLTGVLFGQPVRVLTSDRTRFINFTSLSDLSGQNPIPLRIVGLVLQDTANNRPVVIAWAVAKM